MKMKSKLRIPTAVSNHLFINNLKNEKKKGHREPVYTTLNFIRNKNTIKRFKEEQ